ncbi:restriction endonuclease subunit S [Bacteroides zhangwenhongii]|uniref:restriction endonuclease subunit S n=2 Tax=Bacteroides zhangwenhongii TaxID=2650157 RepID=UPI0015FDAF84|nr:restriction endonuclease subunit S [Bacteroides zhangwenhongii]
MKKWKEYKYTEIASLIGGGTPKTTKKAYWNGRIPWLSVKDFCGGSKYVYNTEKTITDLGLINSSTKLLNKDDIIISARGTVGEIAMLPFEMAFNQSCFGIRANNNRILPDYLYYLTKTKVRELQHASHGAVFNTITKNTFENIICQIPPLEQQKQISTILSSLDDKIELNRRINDNLEQQAQALFKSWFVDFEPFRGEKFVKSEFGMIPKGWYIGSIYEQIDVVYGAPYSSSLFNESNNGLPLIRIRDLKTYSPQVYTTEILPNTEYIATGDVVAGMDAEFIPTIWLGETGILNQRCCKFIARDAMVSNYYVLHLIKPELEFVQSYKTGTTVSHLGKCDIDKFRIIVPPNNIVIKFSKLVNALFREKVRIASESRNLTTLRNSLLPKLMSGELNINNLNC